MMTLDLLKYKIECSNSDNGGGVTSSKDGSGSSMMSAPRVTVELKTPHCVKLARSRGAYVVYADDLICKFITLDAHAHEVGHIYSRLIDTHDQNIALQKIDSTVFTIDHETGVLEYIGTWLAGTGRMWLGLRVPFTILVDAIARDTDVYNALEDAGLLSEAEQLWEEMLSKIDMSSIQLPNDRGSAKRFNLIDLPSMESEHSFVIAIRAYLKEHRDLALIILNPWARKSLCTHIIQIAMPHVAGSTPLQAICMQATAGGASTARPITSH